MAPKRIQLSRRAGYRKPAGAIVVSRPSRWGNPHAVAPGSSDDAYRRAVEQYGDDLRAGRLRFTVDDVRRELRGHDLACWCPPDRPCHADLLLDVANTDNAP